MHERWDRLETGTSGGPKTALTCDQLEFSGPTSRTRTGWRMPTALIESTRADSPCSPNWLRGWNGFGRMRASGTSRSMDPVEAVGLGGMRAPSPFPSRYAGPPLTSFASSR